MRLLTITFLILFTTVHSTAAQDGINLGDPGYQAANSLKAGDYGGAAQRFKTALRQDPDNPYYYYGLGTAYFELKQYHKAIRPYEKAIEKGMKNPEVLLNLSSAYYYFGDPDQAIVYLDKYRSSAGIDDQQLKAARDELDFARQQFGLGMGYKREGDQFRMQSKLQKALRSYPYYREALKELGRPAPTPEIEELNLPSARQVEQKSSREKTTPGKFTQKEAAWQTPYIGALELMLEGDKASLNGAYHLLDQTLQGNPPNDKRALINRYQKMIIDKMTELP